MEPMGAGGSLKLVLYLVGRWLSEAECSFPDTMVEFVINYSLNAAFEISFNI